MDQADVVGVIIVVIAPTPLRAAALALLLLTPKEKQRMKLILAQTGLQGLRLMDHTTKVTMVLTVPRLTSATDEDVTDVDIHEAHRLIST
jgi:hypothetical protein